MNVTRFASLVAIALAAACSTTPDPDSCAATTQDEALDCLGVPTEDTVRVDTVGAALPESYSPLGPTASVGVSAELFLVGMRIAPPVPVGDPVLLDNRAVTVALADDDTGQLEISVLDAIAPGTLWETDTHSSHAGSGADGARSTRAAVAADLDGDGVDELVVAYLDRDDPANAGAVFVEVVGTGAPRVVAIVDGAADVAVVRLDGDGDGDDELAIAAAAPDAVALLIVDRDAAGALSVLPGAERQLATVIGGAAVSTELAAGNLDRDGGDELVVVVNELIEPSGFVTAVSRYRVFDDASAGYAERVPSTPIRVDDGGSYEADVADVAVGDIDADGRDEIVFGGLDELLELSCRAYLHLYLALDDGGDAAAPFGAIGQRAESLRYIPASGCDEITVELPVQHVFVNTLDVDGDGVAEIQANLRVFDDFRAGAFVEQFALDPEVLAGPEGRGGSGLSPSRVGFEVADIDGNGRDEILVFVQHGWRLAVWGLDGPSIDTAIFREMLALDTEHYNSDARVFPIIAAANLDRDGVVLKYSDAEHHVVFTQPVIIAALAAAPCAEGIGQNLTACATSYGTSSSSSGGIDGTVSVSASTFVSLEAQDPFLGIGVEGRESLTATASFSASLSYTLTETVEYTTGPLEDAVVFTSIPLDQYRYTVIAHPDPDLVGTWIVINLPRSPITLQVEREFYNRSVVAGSFQVGAEVFHHTPGDLDSYLTEADADALIAAGAGIKTSRPVTVGQGGGQTSTEIVFSEVTEYRAGAEIAYEAELAVTGGGLGVGAGIGGSVGAGLSWGTSSSTIYRGSIGSLDAEHFAAHRYDAGLFTYIFGHGNPAAPQFEVIDYWVARP